ncbi:MAG: GTPase RsgA [Wujia sp.]
MPVVILTKVDLCSNPGRYIREIEDLSEKVRVHTISALYGIGLDELEEYLIPGNIIAILGSSGVGKSAFSI